MKITREAKGTRFEEVEANNGSHNFYRMGIEKLGVMLTPERKIKEGEYFVPNGNKLVTRQDLYMGVQKEYTHDEFAKEFKL